MDDHEPRLPSGQSDFDLKQQLLKDDEAVFALIMRKYGVAVAAALRRHYQSLNEHDVEDVLASAIYRLWNYRKQLDVARGSLLALLLRIADNVVRNLFKKGWNKLRWQEVTLDETGDLAAALAVEPTAVDSGAVMPGSGAGNTFRQDVQRVIDKLPSDYRHIILADANARDRVASAAMLSEELKIPVGTVWVYRNRAMAAIRRELRELGYEVP